MHRPDLSRESARDLIPAAASVRCLLSVAALMVGAARPSVAVSQTTSATDAGLYEPRNVKAAYAAGTRSRDGLHGPEYWQNRASYRITIDARPPDRTIRGSEVVTYFNNSPDTLSSLVIRLMMNVHLPVAPRFGATSEDFFTAGVHVDSFAVNDSLREWRDSRGPVTWKTARLPTALAPGDSVQLRFDWHYDLAEQASREGVIDSTTYYLAYFYPRVAVYDDYQGWDRVEHVPSHEFYSDFNDYDVTVRVPGSYVVWGTGTLENADELLQAGPLARYRASLSSDTVVHVATRGQMEAGEVTTGGGANAWHFTARDVPDVAFGLGDHYDWDAASVVVDRATGRRASAQAAYNDRAADFHEMVGYVRQSLGWLSSAWPGVPYPYEKMTAFQGGAGMEYPMMANDASYGDPTFSHLVALHEIAHTYMPFYMGIDETRYGFMDEGWATTLEYLWGVDLNGEEAATNLFQGFRVNQWAADPSAAGDLPIITPGDVLGGGALGINEYGKAALGYLAAKDLLGDETFRSCLHAYMERWHGKHPSPWDFFYTFDDVAGQDLDWFWDNWFFSRGYIDLAVVDVSSVPGGYEVALENVGGMDAPVDLVLGFADGSGRTVHRTPAMWEGDGRHATVEVKTTGRLTSVGMEHGIWVDADTSNDEWSAGPG